WECTRELKGPAGPAVVVAPILPLVRAEDPISESGAARPRRSDIAGGRIDALESVGVLPEG
ncbi:MAG: hypothetical protein L3K02_08990, partial [Thermoplasmata archaeon]|nr:hypothetical protein [Thermoplasmata archaeon]